MLKITPIESKEKQKEYSDFCGSEYLDECMAYAIVSEDELIGILNFKISGKCGYIVKTALKKDCSDIEALDTALRATFNFLDKCGIDEVIYNPVNVYDLPLAEALGFKKNENGDYILNIKQFFSFPCKGSAKKQ